MQSHYATISFYRTIHARRDKYKHSNLYMSLLICCFLSAINSHRNCYLYSKSGYSTLSKAIIYVFYTSTLTTYVSKIQEWFWNWSKEMCSNSINKKDLQVKLTFLFYLYLRTFFFFQFVAKRLSIMVMWYYKQVCV